MNSETAAAAKPQGFWSRHGAALINLFVFSSLGIGMAHQAVTAWRAKEFDFVEAAFSIHNIVLLAVILIRKQHIAINRNIAEQLIALIAFFSGVAFDRNVTTANTALRFSAEAVTAVSIILGTAALINLGRSFGILISVRKIKVNGLYSIVRHPMYLTDILWRTGFILNNPSVLNLVIFGASSFAYVYRALLEEKFLMQLDDYREYMQRVRYRFVPGIF